METYRQLMNSEPSMPEEDLEQGALLTPGILGGPAFVNRLPHRVRSRLQTTGTHIPLDLLVQYVAQLCGLRVDEILSRCREHGLVLARGLIAWYATEYGGATLGEVSRLLRRDVSTLSRTVCRYRRCHPKLFSPHIFSALRTRIELARMDRTVSVLPHTTSLHTNPCTDAQNGNAIHRRIGT